jgi:apoptotic chromatin condensation inducer in the nucleus
LFRLADSESKVNKLSKESELISESAKLAKSVREWDLPKLDQESKRTVTTTDVSDAVTRKKQRTELAEENAEPPKTLDDLFRKTEVTPHIYWLPLTEEQYVQKEADFQKRQAEREVRMEARKLKEAEQEKEKEKRRQAHKEETAAAAKAPKEASDLKVSLNSRISICTQTRSL